MEKVESEFKVKILNNEMREQFINLANLWETDFEDRRVEKC